MSVLVEIFGQKVREVEAAQSEISMEDLKKIAADQEAPRGFVDALRKANGLGLIAEVKKASPSEGVIRPNFDPIEVATAYQSAGVQCMSVLTDEKYFQGSPENLQKAKANTTLPCLRKDFIYHPYQVYQARAWGADAVLLIAASLTVCQISDLQGLIHELGMDALVEVHNEAETETVLSLKCPFVGVNNRDLATFKTTLETSEQLLPAIVESGAIAVSESGLGTRADLDRVAKAGAHAVLIGTSFCKSPDIEAKVREVMGW